jgi:hypothetical protein
MYRINLGHDYDSLLRNTEYQADAEVMQTEVPAGLPPLEFRRWFIARAKARQAVEFLKNKKLEYENMLPANISQIAEQERNLTIRPG